MKFEYDDIVSICEAHGICLPVECVEMVVEITKHALAHKAAAVEETHPTPISIRTDQIAEIAGKYNLGNPRLDALRGFVNEVIIVNGAEYAKSENEARKANHDPHHHRTLIPSAPLAIRILR